MNMRVNIGGGIGAVIVGIFGITSILKGAELIGDCLRSTTYRAYMREEYGVNPFVAGAIMLVMGIILMACITKFDTNGRKRRH